MRWRCYWLGCREVEWGMSCRRCGAEDCYSPDWIQYGIWDDVRGYWHRLRFWLCMGRCEVCGRRLWPWRRRDRWVCSDKCGARWVPF